MQTVEAIQSEVEQVVEAERQAYAPKLDKESKADKIPKTDILKALRRNEDGDAELFIRLHRDHLVFDHAAAQWFVWAGHYWALDTKEEALAGVSDVTEVFLVEMKRQAWTRAGAEKAGQKETAETAKTLENALARRIRDLQTIRRKQAVLHLARAGADTLGISGDEWDMNPWALPVENGVIDLRAGTHRPGQPSEFFKTYAPTLWQGLDAPRETWETCLNSTFGGDARLVSFMARLLGFAITGATLEAVLPILWGAGRNGKTVFLQAIAETLGPDLAGPIESEMLLETRFARQSGGPSSDLLHLRGRRLAWLSETNENRRLNAGKAKLFTGGDLLTGRAPYAARQVTFRPTHKIILLTNHRPRADAQDEALWRRVLLVPFETVFVNDPDPTKPKEHLADLNLADKLKNERPGILAWLVQGCLDWQAQGLNPPESVRAATKEYQDGEDTLKTFRAEKCIEEPTATVRAGALYQAYKAWAESNGEKPLTGTKLGRYFGERFDSGKDMNGKFYVGIGLIT
jgi:putative DNA primase/helicase